MSWFLSGSHDRATDDDARLALLAETPGINEETEAELHRALTPAGEEITGRIREPNSTTDARARVCGGGISQTPRSRMRRAVLGVPSALLVGDVLAMLLTFVLLGSGPGFGIVFAVVTLAARGALNHYRPRMSLAALDDVPRVIGASISAIGLALLAQTVVDSAQVDAGLLAVQAGVFVPVSLIFQAAVFAVGRAVRRRKPDRRRRTLVVGGGRVAATLVDALFDHPDLGLNPVAVAQPRPRPTPADRGDVPVVATSISQVASSVDEYCIDTAILALEDSEAHVDTVIGLNQTGCNILLVPPMFEMHHDGPGVERVRGIPMIRLRPDPTLRLSWWVKRSFDVLVASFALTVLALPMALVAVAILIDSGRPILFWQERVGLDGRLFRLAKFRSMRPESETESQTMWNIGHDPRVSKVGRLLRRTSIDELPQLWNIARGHMSVVGPRPERPAFVEQFTREHERYWARHRVPVGLTGLAQVNGLRGDTSILERARYDNYYIANWSLWLDVKIMMLTVREVLGGRGR